jgi:hypothetical protein
LVLPGNFWRGFLHVFTVRALRKALLPRSGRADDQSITCCTCAAVDSSHRMVRVSAMLLTLASVEATIELTPENWQEAVGSRKVFVKFLAPW